MHIYSRTKISFAFIAGLAAIILTISGCSGQQTQADNSSQNSIASDQSSQSLENAAATIGTHVIPEADITAYIARYRTYTGYTSDSDWATYLSKAGYTAEQIRSQAISYYEQRYAVIDAASAAGISVSDSEIDSAISSARNKYGYSESDSDWQTFIYSAGYTDSQYRDDISYQLLSDKVFSQLLPVSDVPDATIQAYANSNASSYTGRESHCITFDVSDPTSDAQMNAAYSEARSAIASLTGTPSVAQFDAVGDDCVSSGAATQSGRVGWSCFLSLSNDYKTALALLSPGQISSSPIETTKGYCIIMCTGYYKALPSGSLDLKSMPSDIYTQLVADAKNDRRISDEQEYMQGLVSSEQHAEYAMPSGLSYDVDMSLANTSSSAAQSSSESDAEIANAIAGMSNSNANATSSAQQK